MSYVFLMGFLLGLRHALDADHVAAVATLASRTNSTRDAVRVGIAWGVGHALTLLVVCVAVLAFGIGFSEALAGGIEFLVGIMLVLLGADVVRRVIRDRIHAHGHSHGARGKHLHVHSHADEQNHKAASHSHAHRSGLAGRAALVGLMHGLAGSAALLVVSLVNTADFSVGVAYVVLFGAGSMLGMAALSATIALPLRLGVRFLTWGYNGVHAAIGVGTVVLGAVVISDTAPAAMALVGLGYGDPTPPPPFPAP